MLKKIRRKRIMKKKSYGRKLLSLFTIATMGVLLTFSSAFAASSIVTAPVNISTAGNYAILAQSGISTVPDSVITGDIGVSPIVATAITGFSLTADATNVFSTSPQVTGKVYAADYAAPASVNLTAAVGNMRTAYIDASRSIDVRSSHVAYRCRKINGSWSSIICSVYFSRNLRGS